MKVIISFLFFFVILPVYVLSQVPEYAKIKIDFVIHQDGEQINLFEGEVFRFFPEVSGILFFNDTIPLDTSVFQVVNITSNKRTPRIIFGEVSLASDNLNEHMDRVAQKKYARISVDGLPSVFLNYEEQQSIPEENGKDLEGNLLERNIKDESTEPHVVAYYLLTVFLSFILGFFLRPFLARKKQRQLRQTSEQKKPK